MIAALHPSVIGLAVPRRAKAARADRRRKAVPRQAARETGNYPVNRGLRRIRGHDRSLLRRNSAFSFRRGGTVIAQRVRGRARARASARAHQCEFNHRQSSSIFVAGCGVATGARAPAAGFERPLPRAPAPLPEALRTAAGDVHHSLAGAGEHIFAGAVSTIAGFTA